MPVGIKRKAPRNFWLDEETDNIIDNNMKRSNFQSRGITLSYLVRMGDLFIKNLQSIKANPEVLEKAMIEMDEMRKQEKLGLFFEGMSHEQRNAVIDMIKLIDTGEWKQTRLL